jgi:hypothetical protein
MLPHTNLSYSPDLDMNNTFLKTLSYSKMFKSSSYSHLPLFFFVIKRKVLVISVSYNSLSPLEFLIS